MADSSTQQKLLEQGIAFTKNGEFKEALKAFEQGSHWLEAGKVALRLKKNDKAIEYFVKAKAFQDAANVHLSSGDFQDAATLFSQAGAFTEAAMALEQWLKKKHDIHRANVVAKGVPRDARNVVKDIINNFTKSEHWQEAATWFYASGEKIKAADFYLKSNAPQKAATIYEEHSRFFDAGNAWKKANEFMKAAEAYKKAESYLEAGEAFELASAYDAAITCYRRAKRLDLAGRFALKQGKTDQAAEIFEETELYLEAAQCYRQSQQHDKLIDTLVLMSKSDANYNKACLLIIDASIKKGEISFQVDDFLKEFLLLPFSVKTVPLFFEFGKIYEKLEFYESAQEIYKKIGEVAPDYNGLKERLEFVHLQITGTPMAMRKILEDDFGYKATSERLAGYQHHGRPGAAVPAPNVGANPITSKPPKIEVSGEGLFKTSNFSVSEAKTSNPPMSSGSEVVLPIHYNPGELLFGRYKVIEKIGSGTSSTVCRVLDQEIDDEVALKVLDSKATYGPGLEEFKKEIKIARKLKHPNIVSIYDFGKRDGHHYLTLESVQGRELKKIIEQDGRFTAEKGIPLVLQICEGLQAIHNEKIVHRDLKPQNIKLRPDGVLKILDFGLSSNVDISSDGNASQYGLVVGSVAYMSPEQIQGQTIDHRSDIYSLGVIMYELFTEQLPFDSRELKALIHQQLNDRPTPPSAINSGLPPKLEECILKCMSKNRDERYRSCQEIIDLLSEVAGINRNSSAIKSDKPKVINERYEIKGEIGRGGMGVVYRAFDTSLQRDVALKFLPHELSASPDDLNSFMNEARSAARLNHTNIVTIHNIEKFDKEHFIVMEYIDGVDIHNLLETMEKLPFKSIDLISRQVCDALDYAHKRKVFHRDIKSANILWTNDKIVKITDFGLAKIVEGVLAASTRVQGSPAYMSPEQILGKNVDHRTDIYSLGVTLYEMTTGFVPFSKGDISYHQLHTEPTPVVDYRPDTPEHLQKIIAGCMKKNPDERFQSAAEIMSLLPKM